MYAEILTIGDELTRGEIVDTNSSWLAAQLWDLEVTVRWMTSCRDDPDDMRRAFRDAAGRADLVLCSGGLGPTEDDLTVDVVAELAGVAPVIDEPSRARMEALFTARGAAMQAIQLRQVRIPTGAAVYPNPAGLAPGFEVAIAGTPVACMPGVPRELHAIFAGSLVARIGALRGAAPRIARRIFRVFGRGESQVSAACRGLVDDVAGASIHYQVKFPETLVKLVVRDADLAAAQARLDALDLELRSRLGAHLYGSGEVALPEVVAAELRASGLKVATAESCTGGMIGQVLSSVPGSSAYLAGGAIVYSNDEKVRQLGVDPATIAEHGAVSEAVVAEMAIGARARFGVDLTVAVSGIAGPDGGSADKPVGTVWFGFMVDGRLTSEVKRFDGDRRAVRQATVDHALEGLLQRVAATPPA